MHSSVTFMSFIVYKGDKLPYVCIYNCIGYVILACNIGRTAPLLPLVYKTETSTLTIREGKSLIVPGTKKRSVIGCHDDRQFSFSTLPRARITRRTREGGLGYHRVLDRRRLRPNDRSSRKCVPSREIPPCQRGS